jgi:AICAR transformylase/IMP cyclohydrolase PurH
MPLPLVTVDAAQAGVTAIIQPGGSVHDAGDRRRRARNAGIHGHPALRH